MKSWMSPGCELRDYQTDGVNWLSYSWCHDINGILADEMVLFTHCYVNQY